MERRPTTQDISWFLDMQRNEQLDLQPSYQRRSVWSAADRRFFLDTIFRDYPSPAIYLHKTTSSTGKHVFEVVDGKQRLETILQFVANKIAVAADFGDDRIAGKRWRQITDPKLRQRFWDYVLPVEFLREFEGQTINAVFDRLNRNSRRLERQELRHARYDGWLVSYVETEIEDPFWRDVAGIATRARAKRMKDVQFLSELVAVVLRKALAGFDQDGLDDLYAAYESPSDTTPDFEASAVAEEMVSIKAFISLMHRRDNSILKPLATFSHLYTLWGVVALHRHELLPPGEAADRYSALLRAADRFRDSEDLDAVAIASDDPLAAVALSYARSTSGASTEAPQRQARHDALLKHLRRMP